MTLKVHGQFWWMILSTICTGNSLALAAAQGQIIFVIVVWVQSWMSAPMPPQLLVVCQAGLHLCQVRTDDGLPEIVRFQLGWGTLSVYEDFVYWY
jgi:hypothetical protein